MRPGSPEETKALVEQSTRLIERIRQLQIDRDEAQASLEVVRRILMAHVADADARDEEGQPCWCEHRNPGEGHELSCIRMQGLIRRLAGALEVKP